jgi:hypothetical protein
MGGGVRRAIGCLVTVALLAAAFGFYVASPRRVVTSAPPPVNHGEPSPTRTSIQPASPTPTPTETTNQTPGRSPDRNLPPGPGGREPGIRITATLTSHGDFEIVETVRLAEPVTQLALAVPDLGPAGPSLRATHPVADALKVTADDHSIKLSTRIVRRSITVPLPRPADLFELSYRLSDVTVMNTPSSAGRALGGLGPMATGVPEELPVAITVRGHSIRNLSCPRLPIDDQSCAAGRSPRLRVERNLARRDALVLVQFDISATQVGAPQ